MGTEEVEGVKDFLSNVSNRISLKCLHDIQVELSNWLNWNKRLGNNWPSMKTEGWEVDKVIPGKGRVKEKRSSEL